jgi:hypothetical protein
MKLRTTITGLLACAALSLALNASAQAIPGLQPQPQTQAEQQQSQQAQQQQAQPEAQQEQPAQQMAQPRMMMERPIGPDEPSEPRSPTNPSPNPGLSNAPLCIPTSATSCPTPNPNNYVPPSQDNKDATGAIMCLTQIMMAGSKPTECAEYVTKYFQIRDYRHGGFDPEATAKKRQKWLEKCTDCQASDIRSVQLRFGRMPSL